MRVAAAPPLVRRPRRGKRSITAPDFGLALLALIIGCALFGPILIEFDPERAAPLEIMQPPSAVHWLGTNSYGADVFSRVVHAGRLDLLIGTVSVIGALLIAMPIGALIGYAQGWWNPLVMRVLDFVQSFPPFILAMALATVTGPSVINIILIIGFLNVPIFARLIRSEVLAFKERAFVEAAKCSGNSDLRLVIRHILPNALSSSVAQASVNIGWAMILAAGLSFVGAGVEPPTPEWGAMISEGAQYIITGEWWIAAFPGIALGLSVLSFALVGEAVSAWLNVRKVGTVP
ncbi:MAG: ABC transporter permease [Rhodospirillales bacterium]|nr:ABC transporter permease [Rhodospirillales bacterium]